MTDSKSPRTLTEEFVDWAMSCEISDVPIEVQEDIAVRVLDHIGLCLVGSVYGFGHRAQGGMQWAFGALTAIDGKGCTIVGTQGKHSVAVSALTNAINAHAHDFDDTHLEAVAHASSVVLSTALAVAEQTESSWSETLVAAATGYEMMIRLGLIAPAHLVSHGFHPTSINGTFGAAMTAAKLQKTTTDGAVDALGISGSFASGILQTVVEGTDTKRLHPGWAAVCGILSNQFALASFGGPRQIIEGRFGLVSTHIVGPQSLLLNRLVESLGSRWEVLNTVLKPFPCCHLNHAFIESALELRERNEFSIDDVVGITCYIAAEAANLVCEPWENKVQPRSAYEAKFSLPFSVAVALLDGHVSVDTYSQQGISRRDVMSVAQRVRYEIDDASTFPVNFPGKVRILFADGSEQYSETKTNLGGSDRPLNRRQIEAKFRQNADAAGFSEEWIENVTGTLFSLEASDPISKLMDAVAAPDGDGFSNPRDS